MARKTPMKWTVHHLDWPEDTQVARSFSHAKILAWCGAEDFTLGRRDGRGVYNDCNTGMIITPQHGPWK